MGKRASRRFEFATSGIIVSCLFVALSLTACSREPEQTFVPPPPTISLPMVNPWKKAAGLVEEDRGEPIGRKAQVEVPEELKHYSDRRKFLAVQLAEYREQNYQIPHDYAELVELISKGQLAELEPLGQDYILYGVGANATDEPFTHYDAKQGRYIPLHANNAQVDAAYTVLNDSTKQLQTKIADLQKQFRATGKRDRAARKTLLAEVAENRKAAQSKSSEKKLLDYFYKNAERRKQLFSEYKAIADFAASFDGSSYNLDEPAERQKFRVRLLSFIRPEARAVLLEIARTYKEEFDRPLPVTSLVRTEQYQERLSETNPNATRTAVPPHTTGLAFDIYYHYMTAAEQNFLMTAIARLKFEGRVEALRETRDHIHVFAFPDGRPPDEKLIAQSLGRLGGDTSNKRAAAKGARSHKKSSAATQRASRRSKKSKQVAQTRNGKKSRPNN